MFAFRGITIGATMLPNPTIGCVPPALSNAGVEALKIMFGLASTCADVFFSGHTTTGTLMALMWWQYSDVVPLATFNCGQRCKRASEYTGCTPVKAVVWAFAVAGFIVIIWTRFHYSIDVLIGLVLSTVVWRLYHHSIDEIYEPSHTSWFYEFLRWFEHHAEDLETRRREFQAHNSVSLGAVPPDRFNTMHQANFRIRNSFSEKREENKGATVAATINVAPAQNQPQTNGQPLELTQPASAHAPGPDQVEVVTIPVPASNSNAS